MNTPNSEKKIILKDGTYFKVDADARYGDDTLTLYTPEKTERTCRTWINGYGDVVAFCWLENFLSEELIS